MKKDWNYGKWEKSRYVSTGKRGYWSKYGGGEKWKEPAEENWVCQSCTLELYNFMPSYKLALDSTESARICSLCKHLIILHDILIFQDLLVLMQPFGRRSNAIANLLTLPLM